MNLIDKITDRVLDRIESRYKQQVLDAAAKLSTELIDAIAAPPMFAPPKPPEPPQPSKPRLVK